MAPELYLRSDGCLASASTEMREIGVCKEGIDIMLPKMRHLVFMVRNLDPRGANILKQEMLAVGGEAAISYHAISDISKPTDCLLSGTARQFGIAIPKLRIQPFGLKHLAEQMQNAITNLERRPRTVGPLTFNRTLIMGILNVTPDSFSGDGIPDTGGAVAKAVQMEKDGADIIDIGGESTRPGATPVSTDDELARILPVIESLKGKLNIPVSIDSRNPEVIGKALKAGAGIVNLVGGMRDAGMADMIAKAGVPVILMHMQGEPGTMQNNPVYCDVMDDIVSEMRGQIRIAVDAGIDPGMIIVDPGIGFGKTAEHNLEILGRLGEMCILGMPILIGTSRKSFIGKVTGKDADDRLGGSLASAVLGAANLADIVRVHDVRDTVPAIQTADAIINKSAKSII